MRTPKPVQERRRAMRVAESLPFKIAHQDYEIEAVTVNISAVGALCRVERDIPMMTQLRVALSLPALRKGARRPKVISLKGAVVRKDRDPLTQRYLLAVYFSDIRAQDREFLKKFIESRLPPNA